MIRTLRKMGVKMNLIAAMCENRGIGKNNNLPWRLKSEMAHFTKMTSETDDPNKKNVVIMGRKSWDSIPKSFKPLRGRINIVLSRNPEFKIEEDGVIVKDSLDSVVDVLSQPEYLDKVESVWVIGGSYIYQEAMKSKYFHRLYLTEIMKDYDCDTFMPELNQDLKIVTDPKVPTEVQEENGVKYIIKVYENLKSGED